VTVPAHKEIPLGTFHTILPDVAAYLEMEPTQLVEELFRR
jgi:hypothetical protein